MPKANPGERVPNPPSLWIALLLLAVLVLLALLVLVIGPRMGWVAPLEGEGEEYVCGPEGPAFVLETIDLDVGRSPSIVQGDHFNGSISRQDAERSGVSNAGRIICINDPNGVFVFTRGENAFWLSPGTKDAVIAFERGFRIVGATRMVREREFQRTTPGDLKHLIPSQ